MTYRSGTQELVPLIDRRRILIIDRNRRTVDELQEKFVSSGCEAEIALSAPVGLSIIASRKMDVAVMNAELGHQEDWELVKTLKESNPELPLVLFDAPKQKGLSREARRAGVERLLVSPMDADIILAETLKVVAKG